MNRLYDATVNSCRGLLFAVRSEAAVRQEIIALLLALVIAPLAAPGPAWFVAMVGAILFVVTIELLNTAIEKFADYVTPQHHPTIGLIKDVSSAAVFFALAVAALIWLTAIAVRLDLL